MARTRSGAKKDAEPKTKPEGDAAEAKPDVKPDVKREKSGARAGSKRKAAAADGEGKPAAKSAKTASAPQTALDWLLSDAALDLAYPELPRGDGETDLPKSEQTKPPPPAPGSTRGKAAPGAKTENDGGSGGGAADAPPVRYPTTPLTPFEALVCACILSKPLSHRLGLRTIQTLFGPPFGLRSPAALEEAGYEGRRAAMWAARTQHKEKTAAQLGDVVDGVRELCGDAGEEELGALSGIHERLKGKEAGEAQEVVRAELTKIKGIGPGVVSIFLRRVQADWPEVFPYADDRALHAAAALELVAENGTAADLARAVGDDRLRLVRLLDVLVGLELEKKLDEARQLAGLV